MNWFKIAKLEKDWYKTWIYHISEVVKHFFNFSSQDALEYSRDNMNKNILLRYTSEEPEILDIEYNIDQMKIFLTYLSYFYIIDLRSEKNELNVIIYPYRGVDFLIHEDPINAKLILDDGINAPYEIVSEIKKFIQSDGNAKYNTESKLIFQEDK